MSCDGHLDKCVHHQQKEATFSQVVIFLKPHAWRSTHLKANSVLRSPTDGSDICWKKKPVMSKSSVTKSRKCQERGEKGFKPVLGEDL